MADMDSRDFKTDACTLLKQLVSDEKPQPNTSSTESGADGEGVEAAEHAYGIYIRMQFNNQYKPETWVAGYPHLFPYELGAPGSVKNFGLIAFC